MRNNTLLRFHDGSESTVAQAIERQECRPGMTIKPARDYARLRQLKRQRRLKALMLLCLSILGWAFLAVMILAFVVGVVFLYIAFTA